MNFIQRNYFVLLLSTLLTLMMYKPIMELSFPYFIISIAYLFLFHYSIFSLSLYLKKITIVFLPFLIFICTICAYLFNFLNIKISDNLLFLLLETTQGESGEALTSKFIASIFLACIFALLTYIGIRKSTPQRPLIPILLLVLLIPVNVALAKWDKHPIARELRPAIATKYAFPFCVIDSLANFSIRWVQYKTRPEPKSSALLASEQISPQNNEPLTLVFVIGESARADHFQLNGYTRETTPRLMREPNVISFGAIRSFAALTRISVPVMLTPATSDEPEIVTNSFIDLFVKHGFSTAWISANSKVAYSSDMPTTRIMGNAQRTFFRNDFTTADYSTFKDEMMLPVLQEVLSTSCGNRVIIIHTRGSHFNYSTKYAKKYRKFTPDNCNEFDNLEKIVNAYDNSILATDGFLADIIAMLKEQNALVIYSSDHGESLGEEGIFMHGNAKRPEQRNVPFIIWYSDKYKENSPNAIAALEKHVGSELSHDVLFPWTINLGGIILPDSDLPALLEK
ncbi:phosphoethanolamine transferase [Halodesulfovibrio spirochaetisodalis]|uniref:Sulfatase N-terminal domain-containing protein n=1 Tax=Halodesulfovibrio spirochaetisodalis TaxID=1560234 RepID=A0A1B7XDH6_9BACT|nr:phosphoethanolamine transferase [Halodesulfovibrio spirochaetisodalis]OBQ52089.1 hypothetical protein SP90_07830 [Halodesulfovibrio spirochaetisodalis]